MLPEDIDAVTASYHRCLYGDGFIDTFYELFLAKSPDVKKKFGQTDFRHQKLMLRESLLMMVMFNRKELDVRAELEELAERHSSRDIDIPPKLYELWLDALCEAVKTHDSEFAPELEKLWRLAMQPGIDLLTSKY